jgi:glycosyltransferase involved in cell wall biosynthesis
LKILLITNLCPPDFDGGFELSAFRNANALRERGHDVHVVTTKFRSEFNGERIDPEWVHRILDLATISDGWGGTRGLSEVKAEQQLSLRALRREFFLRFSNILGLISTLKIAGRNEDRVREFMSRHQFDAVYVFGLHRIGTSVLMPATEQKIPIMLHHGDEWLAYYLKPNFLKKSILSFVNPHRYNREQQVDLTNLYLVSEYMRGVFLSRGFKPEQLKVIYRGVEDERFKQIPSVEGREPQFLLACRLALYKGVQNAIEAAAQLDKQQPDTPWTMKIAGYSTPDMYRYFEDLIAKKNIGHRVQLIGQLTREGVREQMEKSIAVICPSIFNEPFGNTNIEALAAGAVLISSDAGAIKEIISHGKSGLIFDRYSPEELAQQMRLVLENVEFRKSLAMAGAGVARMKFSQSEIIDQIENVFYDLTGQPKLTVVDNSLSATLR